ncbi:putative protein-serine/threonine kinase CMGC-RCK family [Helianthus anomalus]
MLLIDGVELGQQVGYSIRFEDMASTSTTIKYMPDILLLRYTIRKEVGNGTFGVVSRALNKHIGELVAIMKMKRKYYSWEECMNLRDVKSPCKMNHPNIVKLKEVVRENNILYSLFEYMVSRFYSILGMFIILTYISSIIFFFFFYECSLYRLMEDIVKPFSETEIRNWCFYMFQGLVYMHQHGYFPCDFKPGIFFFNDYVGLIVKEYESIEGLVRENLKKLPEANQKLLTYPLFCSLPSEKQMKVFTSAPVGFRNVILATNIAETSVTIPGVKYVIDPGLVKVCNYSPDSGIESLIVVKTSKAQALQRR